jgi:hypothetical protein
MLSGFAHDLQTMALLHFSIFLVVAGSLAAYFFYLIWKNFHRARVIEDTPTARVRSAPQGYVELEGRARSLPDSPVTAPLTRTSCVWYRFKIDREKHNSRSGSSWEEVESGRSETAFVFYDDTGECLVDPRKAEVTPGVKKVWYGSSRWPGGEDKRGFFGVLVGTRYRYTEERIDNERLYILGWFDTLRSTDQSVSAELSKLLKSWKQDQQQLLQRFDENNDGRIDEHEWQQARDTAHRQVVQDRAARSAQAATNVLRDSGHTSHPFLISAKPQYLLAGRYRRHALFSLLGSLVASGFLAWMLVVRF